MKILSVRVPENLAREVNEIAEEYQIKSEGYREVLELGVEAHAFDRSPTELDERARRVEAELDKSVWQRLDRPTRVMVAGAIVAVVGLVPLVLGLLAIEMLGVSEPPLFGIILEAGVWTSLLGTALFLVSSLWAVGGAIVSAASPDVEE